MYDHKIIKDESKYENFIENYTGLENSILNKKIFLKKKKLLNSY